MQTTRLGRTGLEVGVAGLGCGGHSRLGMATGHDEAHAERVVASALDLGIDFLDTARVYGTETVVGRAVRGRRDRVVISTKALPASAEGPLGRRELRESLEKSLSRLGTDYVDLFHLHGVREELYSHCVDELVPELLRLREQGKLRFLGITEHFGSDTSHRMLARSLPDELFDVIMVGFNVLNPSARRAVFPETQKRDIGTLIMFAVRRALSRPEAAAQAVGELIASGQIEAGSLDADDPLAFARAHPDVGSLVQAAYRFCRHEPGADVILTGTGSPEHLRENVDAILAPPLPEELQERLRKIFGNVDSVSGN